MCWLCVFVLFVCVCDMNQNSNGLTFLGALPNLRKATVSFLTPVCLSVYPHGTAWPPL